jgi:hypothetical protein
MKRDYMRRRRLIFNILIRVSIIRIFIRIFFLENYSLFEYFLSEYSNNNFLLNKPYKNVNFQTIFPKKMLKTLKNAI